MSFFGGIVHDVDSFFAGLEHTMATDLAPMAAKVRRAFTDALGNMAQAEYETVKGLAHNAIVDATKAAGPDVADIAHAAFNTVKAQLPQAGIIIEDTALHALVAMLV